MDRDLVRRCSACGVNFIWTVTEQRSDAPPAFCPPCRKLAPAPGRQRGLVKWYSRGRGYGFITPAEGPDVFVHKSGLDPAATSLHAGQLVEFALSHGTRGIQAEQVLVLPSDEAAKPGAQV